MCANGHPSAAGVPICGNNCCCYTVVVTQHVLLISSRSHDAGASDPPVHMFTLHHVVSFILNKLFSDGCMRPQSKHLRSKVVRRHIDFRANTSSFKHGRVASLNHLVSLQTTNNLLQ